MMHKYKKTIVFSSVIFAAYLAYSLCGGNNFAVNVAMIVYGSSFLGFMGGVSVSQ